MRNPWGIVAGSNEGTGASFPRRMKKTAAMRILSPLPFLFFNARSTDAFIFLFIAE